MQGFDLMPLLEMVGIGGELGATVGTWAASVVGASTIYPFTLAGMGYIVPFLNTVQDTSHK